MATSTPKKETEGHHAGQLEAALDRLIDEARRRDGRSVLEQDTEFETASRLLVDLVANGLNGVGDPSHITWLVRRFDLRRKREWTRICTLAFDDLDTRLGMLHRLVELAPEAVQLTERHVVAAFRNTRTASGFAASLAVACGAFGYEDQHKAKKAFENLKDE